MLDTIMSVIGDTGSWILDKLNEGIFGFINQMLESTLLFTFELMNTFLLGTNDLGAYYDYNPILSIMQFIAGGILPVAIAFQGFKQVSGSACTNEEKSLTTLIIQTVYAAALIFFLPWTVENIFLKINNLLVQAFTSADLNIEIFDLDSMLDAFNFAHFGVIIIGLVIVIAIGFAIIGVLSGIRYIELLIAVFIAPIVAISMVSNRESLRAWVENVTAITFTQVLHVVLLHMLISIMGGADSLMKPILIIAILMVMIRGPRALKQYLNSTGVVTSGASTVGMVSQVIMSK